jgi:hypothetical protein
VTCFFFIQRRREVRHSFVRGPHNTFTRCLSATSLPNNFASLSRSPSPKNVGIPVKGLFVSNTFEQICSDACLRVSVPDEVIDLAIFGRGLQSNRVPRSFPPNGRPARIEDPISSQDKTREVTVPNGTACRWLTVGTSALRVDHLRRHESRRLRSGIPCADGEPLHGNSICAVIRLRNLAHNPCRINKPVSPSF